MLYAYDGVGQDHPGAYGSHDFLHLFLHVRTVTVNRAFATGCFVVLKRAVVQAFFCVF